MGADWNTECADRILTGQAWDLYEPADPYAGVEWFADLVYQCQWDYDEMGRRRHWADRRPGDVLWAGGLYDVAAVTGARSRTRTRALPAASLVSAPAVICCLAGSPAPPRAARRSDRRDRGQD